MSEQAGINNVLLVAVEVGETLNRLQIPYCFIGGVANQRWGEPRQTVDVDATLFVGFGNELRISEQLLGLYEPRRADARDFAVRYRILLLQSAQGTGIDLSLGGLPYEQRVVDRSSIWQVPRHGDIRTCSAEDLIVLKAFANRPLDWIDIERVLIRQGKRLEFKVVLSELEPLTELKEEPEILERLRRLMSQT